jgi:hypothetical protein
MALAVLIHTTFDGAIVAGVVAASVLTYLGLALVGLLRRAR